MRDASLRAPHTATEAPTLPGGRPALERQAPGKERENGIPPREERPRGDSALDVEGSFTLRTHQAPQGLPSSSSLPLPWAALPLAFCGVCPSWLRWERLGDFGCQSCTVLGRGTLTAMVEVGMGLIRSLLCAHPTLSRPLGLPASLRVPSPPLPFHSGDPCSPHSCPLFLSCLTSPEVLRSPSLSPWPASA